MSKPIRPILRWHGGKWLLAPWIIENFPPHQVYTEVYGGAGYVLIRKSRSYAEVYNDMDGDVINLFRVIQDEKKSGKLINKLKSTPFARDEYALALESDTAINEVEKARRLIIRSFMGFGSNASNSAVKSGFRANSNRSGSTPAHDWNNYPDALPAIVDRFKGVIIENRPAVQILKQHDSLNTLHYVDPPYVHSTRCNSTTTPNKGYKFEMTNDDHRELSDVLYDLDGMVILSGYPCDLYEGLYPNWLKIERTALADGARKRIECLWLNEAAAKKQNQMNLFHSSNPRGAQ